MAQNVEMVCVKLNRETKRQLRILAATRDISLSELLRQILEKKVQSEELLADGKEPVEG